MFIALSKYDSGLERRLERAAARARREISRLRGLSARERARRLDALTRRYMVRVAAGEERHIIAATQRALEAGLEAGTISREAADRLTTLLAPERVPLIEEAQAATTVARVARPVQLSRRLHRNARLLGQNMQTVLDGSLQQGDGVVAAAEELLALQEPMTALPQYIEKLRSAMQHGAPGEVRRAAREAVRNARRLGLRDPTGPSTLRNSAQHLIRSARSGRVAEFERQIQYYVVDQQRYIARRVARTEASRAFNQAYIDSVRNSPNVKGMQWNLSSSHPEPDVCDMYASVDPAGLGTGVYPENELQQIPAHPHCLCYYTAVMRSVDEIRTGRDAPPGRRVSPNQWLRSQSAERQDSILGPGRGRAFRRGRSVLASDGTGFRPLRDIQRRT